ncbi:hypothetical protein CAPTEDRAFT_139119 [Capitella teleta]|uniref:L-Fucosyltransferase n=1 Tax=Capitella teleta TaxID=283909 RepID=R7TTW6_CAPTE|nr:hypothetical protein CAPTEDRAFT_139119 [Capitella teleta]|eukprot:ELT97124.1 hypothetical protein CAPTEDRAFT_139119 [Capitella teleta]
MANESHGAENKKSDTIREINQSISTKTTAETKTKEIHAAVPEGNKAYVDNRSANDVYVTCLVSDGRRTGNLLFNYAASISTAWRYSLKLLVHPEFQLQNYFKMNVEVDKRVREWSENWTVVAEKAWGIYDDKFEHLDEEVTRSNFSLYGFYQSWKYFKSYEDDLRRSLVFRDDVIGGAQNEMQRLIPNVTFVDHPMKAKINGGTLVGLHVRRGDILLPEKLEFGYTIPEMSFFRNAVAFFVDRYPHLHVMVCCEDIVWCQSNLRGLAANVYFSHIDDGIVDLAILSMSEHVIMTTGSFGWWGAWLANGTTVYYSDWPRNSSMLSQGFVKEDYFMPHWIPMT